MQVIFHAHSIRIIIEHLPPTQAGLGLLLLFVYILSLHDDM